MVITNSEVSMASKRSFSTEFKSSTTTTYQPTIMIGGNVSLVKAEGNSNTTTNQSSTGLTVQDQDGNSFLSSLNYALGKNGQVAETDAGSGLANIGSASRQVRLQTMSYLLRLLLYARMNNDDSFLSQILENAFSSTNTYLETVTSTSDYSQSEETSFESTGTVITADGRQLSFNYSFTMSYSFSQSCKESYQQMREINLVDPLVINLDSNPGEISDQKFYFDLDADGSEEEISSLGAGKGFLALDKNEDGVINNGLELFGTKSGDGFSDLAAYDEDGNGWIDENDSIFSKLRIWTINEEGQSELYGLKESDIGAIYLAQMKTNFTACNDAHETQGIIRETGIFLHESTGAVGSIQHVDLAT